MLIYVLLLVVVGGAVGSLCGRMADAGKNVPFWGLGGASINALLGALLYAIVGGAA